MSGDLTHIPTFDCVGGDRISCSFLWVRHRDKGVDRADVAVPTGGNAWRLRLRHAAQMHALGLDYRMWAMPHLVHAASGDWLVYERAIGAEQAPVFLKRLPTRDAAEMWMLHGG